MKLATVQKRGQVTIPIEMRRKWGIEEGGVVAFVETEEGILISPREVLAMEALERIGQALKEQGITLEEMRNYCAWRVSGVFQLVDPMTILALLP